MKSIEIFNQKSVNELTDYLLRNSELIPYIEREEWAELFASLYTGDSKYKEQLGFLYQYFMELDNFNVLTIMETIPGRAFQMSDIKAVEIPSNIKRIGSEAFWYAELKSVNIQEGVKEIGIGAFDSCYSLSSINLPNSVNRISEMAFSGDKSLEEITLPDSIEVLYYSIFSHCSNLKVVHLGKKLRQINSSVFAQCENLEVITYPGTIDEWQKIRKLQEWNLNCKAFKVQCSDGDIEIAAFEYDS